jgi:integrase/recombinase XerD
MFKSMKAYLEPDEITKLEDSASNLRDRLLIRMLFHLGCRVSEALGLTVDDIDFDSGSVTIQHLKARISLSCPDCGHRLGRNHTFCPGCGNKVNEAQSEQLERRRRRILPIDKDTLHLLNNYVSRGGPVVKDGKGVIFGINRHRAWQIIKECADKAGLPKLVNNETGKVHNISPHKLRDAFAVNAVKLDDSGDGLRMLQEHLGHMSFDTTARYRKISGQEHRDWYDRLWQKDDNTGSVNK